MSTLLLEKHAISCGTGLLFLERIYGTNKQFYKSMVLLKKSQNNPYVFYELKVRFFFVHSNRHVFILIRFNL